MAFALKNNLGEGMELRTTQKWNLEKLLF